LFLRGLESWEADVLPLNYARQGMTRENRKSVLAMVTPAKG
jgi:hypothetical protein